MTQQGDFEIIDVQEVPDRSKPHRDTWDKRFAQLTPGKAGRMEFTNHYDAEGTGRTARDIGAKLGFIIRTRTMQYSDDLWILYIWIA